MRLVRLLIAVSTLALSFNPVFAPTPAAAQRAPAAAPIPCNGSLNIVRVSEIKPGMMQKFLEAVSAQQAWYKAAGTDDKVEVMRVMEQDPTTKAWGLSETQALTAHIEPAARQTNPPHDAAFDAFVTLFKDSSTIKSQYVTCVVSM
jgi:hypothetical protein